MIGAWLESFLECVHSNQTRPFTLKKSCYTVCLDCGRELPYSWAAMRSLKPAECMDSAEHACEEMSAVA